MGREDNRMIEAMSEPYRTDPARRILAVFREKELIKPLMVASGSRPAVYAFPQLLNIAEGYDAF